MATSHEALLLYVLATGSPTYPLPAESCPAWRSTYVWKRVYDYEFVYAGPLFIHQLSHIWIDFRGIQDVYIRDKGPDCERRAWARDDCGVGRGSLVALRAGDRLAGHPVLCRECPP